MDFNIKVIKNATDNIHNHMIQPKNKPLYDIYYTYSYYFCVSCSPSSNVITLPLFPFLVLAIF